MEHCPFCGGEGYPSKQLRDGCVDGEPDAWAHYICCRSCAATGGWSKSESGAITNWQMRIGRVICTAVKQEES